MDVKASAKVPCLFCGALTDERRYIVNPKAKRELPCCSSTCYTEAKRFIEYDAHARVRYYVLLTFLVVANLIIIGMGRTDWWIYLPMFGMGAVTLGYPLIFSRYERYQSLGIRKTLRVVRIAAACICVFSIIQMLCNK